MFRKPANFLVALPVVVTMFLTAGQAAAESGFAKVRADGSLATFGGPDTNTATSTRVGQGVYSVQFFGSFPSQTTSDKIVVNTTAESAQYGVSNAVAASADAGQITVYVYTWTSNTLTTTDNTFFITVFTTPDPIGAPARANGK
jgi:hypothetical protein